MINYKKSEHLWQLKLKILTIKNRHKWNFWRFKKSSKLYMSKTEFDKKNLTTGIAVKNEKEITNDQKPLQNLLLFFDILSYSDG